MISKLRVPTRRWSRVEYERLVERGVFGPDDRIELIDGQLVVRETQDPPHATTIRLVTKALERVFRSGWDVRPQLPVALDETSEPEPDVVVVRGSPRQYASDHPSKPVLIVEVAYSRHAFDRKTKGGLYARAGIEEYWIVDVVERALEVYREPVKSSGARHGWAYRSIRVLKPGATIAPLAAPKSRVRVADLLP